MHLPITGLAVHVRSPSGFTCLRHSKHYIGQVFVMEATSIDFKALPKIEVSKSETLVIY